MVGFRMLLGAMFVLLLAYTSVTIANHGWNLFPVFFGDMWRFGWPGQFNFDFMLMLMLSALWVAWRNRFSAGGLALSVLALFGGASFLTVYLLVLSIQTRGDMITLLTGQPREASS